jgi:hypothetical protein
MFYFWLNDNSILCHGHENYEDKRISKEHEQTMTKTSLILNQRMKHKIQKKLNKVCKTSIQTKLYYEYMEKH